MYVEDQIMDLKQVSYVNKRLQNGTQFTQT